MEIFKQGGSAFPLNHQQQTLKDLKKNSVFGHFLCRGISWAKSSVKRLLVVSVLAVMHGVPLGCRKPFFRIFDTRPLFFRKESNGQWTGVFAMKIRIPIIQRPLLKVVILGDFW